MGIGTLPFIRALLLCPEEGDNRCLRNVAALHTITFQNLAISITHGIYANCFQTQVLISVTVRSTKLHNITATGQHFLTW